MPCTTLALISYCVSQMPLQLHMVIVDMVDEHRGQTRASAWLCYLQRCRYSPSSKMMYANSSLSACSRQMWCSILVPMIGDIGAWGCQSPTPSLLRRDCSVCMG